MCLRGVERRHEVEKSGVAMRINGNGSARKNVGTVTKVWGRFEKCGDGLESVGKVRKM